MIVVASGPPRVRWRPRRGDPDGGGRLFPGGGRCAQTELMYIIFGSFLLFLLVHLRQSHPPEAACEEKGLRDTRGHHHPDRGAGKLN